MIILYKSSIVPPSSCQCVESMKKQKKANIPTPSDKHNFSVLGYKVKIPPPHKGQGIHENGFSFYTANK